jgi:hypothetical protein
MEPQRSQESGGCPPSRRLCSSAPFTIRLLKHEHDHPDASPPTVDELLSPLPAFYRTESDSIVAASSDVNTCVEIELNLERLTTIFPWLWVAGRPMPPRPLHHQILSPNALCLDWPATIHQVHAPLPSRAALLVRPLVAAPSTNVVPIIFARRRVRRQRSAFYSRTQHSSPTSPTS